MTRKRFVLCFAVLFLAGLLLLPTQAAEDVYYVAVNDTPLNLSQQATPFRVNGITYVPSTVFDTSVTGINLGVYYDQDTSRGVFTMYSEGFDKILEFDLNQGVAYGYTAGKTYDYQIITRNGMVFLPVRVVCSYFGLSSSFLSSTYGTVIRIQNGDAVLNDKMFLDSVLPHLENQGKGTNGQEQDDTIPIQRPEPPVNPNPREEEEEPEEEPDTSVGKGIRLSVAVQVNASTDVEGILRALEANRVKALFFFQPSQLAQNDQILRRLVGREHMVGLIPSGTTSREQLQSLAEGNRLLEHILRQRVYMTLTSGDSTVQEALEQQGYVCWTPQVKVQGQGRSSAKLVQSTLQEIEKRNRTTRILLQDGLTGESVSNLFEQLNEEEYGIRVPRETDD